MAFEYKYSIYNPGQYPEDTQKMWDVLVADGWQVNTADPNYNEICILWQRPLPELVPVEPAAPEPEPRDRDSLGRFQTSSEAPEVEITDTSGGLRAHEGQDSR